MLDFSIKTDDNGNAYIETTIAGKALLSIPQLNKGTAFTAQEREWFGLTGKLPNKIETLDEQIKRAYQQYHSYDLQVNRNIYLHHLLNSNEVLFYRLIETHLKEMLPTVYTPMVGNAVRLFNKKFMHPRGLYISYEHRDQIEKILDNRSNPEIDIIVVSDGEGVLGIGDQGVGAMEIPIAKLMLYTATAGISPLKTLPILLDAGTNNEELLNDPFYLGWRHERLTGSEYEDFIEKFISAVQKKMKHAFLHWEDFGRTNAYQNLIKYREVTCSFNDDIQGTGAVTVGAVLAALQLTGTRFQDQRIVVFGAGTAGIGIVDMIHQTFCASGLSSQDSMRLFWLIDRAGLVTDYTDQITPAQQPYQRSKADVAHWNVRDKANISLLEVVQHVKPTILIGTSAQGGAFTEIIVKTMAEAVATPIIFPLSNPTEKAEARPEDLIHWTNGKALIATGSPSEDITFDNKTFAISLCNNYLAFPGIGLGVVAVGASYVSNTMLHAASRALSQFANAKTHELLPTIDQARETSKKIALAVAQAAIDEGLAPLPAQSLEKTIDLHIWHPHYLPYRRA